MVIGSAVEAPVFTIPANSSATLSERTSGMTPTRMNDRLGSSEEIAEENFPTDGTKMLSEDTRKSFRRAHLILQLASCVIAVSLDPFFLYIPVINHHEKCFDFDKKLRIAALVLRSVTDFIFVLHIAFQFRTGYVAKPILSHIDGVNEIVASLRRIWTILKTYMLSYFLIDILSLLPLPQVVILYIIPEMKGSKSLIARNILTALVLLQYVPRVVRIYPLYKKLTWTPRIFKETTAWTKAALNFFLYMLASHVLGALWYFFSIEREITCWQQACEGHPGCDHSSFFCDDGIRAIEFLHDMCPVDTPNTSLFDFGIFLDALQSGIVESVNLPQKLFRCLWWGLQNMSSLGQNLKTSTYVWENIFAVFISTSGLVLFLYFIGNIQTYLQMKTEKKEKKMKTRSKEQKMRREMRSKVLDVDKWMCNKNLSELLKRRIKYYVDKRWHKIRTVDSENLIPILPTDLQKDVIRHFCPDLLKRVPVFASMDGHLLDAMSGRLKPVVYSTDSYVVRKGDPVEQMCFILHGKVLSDANVGRTELHTGDFCGNELLTWVFNVRPLPKLPISNQTAQALTKVEAFVLTAQDLDFLICQFRLQHRSNFNRILKCYSPQWRTWAACVIQRKLKESLRAEEVRSQDALAETSGTSISIGATKEAEIITSMHLQKPAEPDFVVEDSSYMWRE